MWNLTRLDVESYRQHIDVAFPTGGGLEEVSEAEKLGLLQLYSLYEEKLGRPCVDLIGEGERPELYGLLHDAYSLVQDGRRLGKLRAALKLLAEVCPYCGFGQVDELDHFLQRGQYKLLSIFPLNLVPCCGVCNRGKRKAPSAVGSEHQVHVYLEDLKAFDFFRAHAAIDAITGGLVVRFSIFQCEGMTTDLYERLVNHLIEFRLQERYGKQVNIFLGELEYSIKSTFEKMGADGLKAFLNGTAASLKMRFGLNDWRTSLMRGLEQCPEFFTGGFETALGQRPHPVEAVA